MSQVLPKGYGTPFQKIFFGSQLEELRANIVKLVYKQVEGEDTIINITIQTNDPYLPDQPQLQEDRKITVLWGYLQGVKSKKKIGYIRNIKPNYTSKGLTITFKLFPKTSLMRDTPKETLHKDFTMEDLAKDLAKERGLNYKGIEFVDENTFAYTSSSLENGRSPSYLAEEGNYVAAVDNTAQPIFTQLKRYEELPQAYRSDYKLLKEMAEREPGGPYMVEGEGDDLRVRKRDFNQTPVRAYTWKGGNGELISFTPETESSESKTKSTNVEVTNWDREGKTFTKQNTNQNTSVDTKLGNQVDGSPRENASQQDEDLLVPFIETPNDTAREPLEIHTKSVGFLSEEGYETAAVDNTSIIIRNDIYDHLDSIEDNAEDAKAAGQNRNEGAQIHRNPGSAVVVGDPRLEVGKIITIYGVSRKYTGNYYLQEVEHNITPSGGYTCTLKISRNATKDIEGSNKLDVSQLEANINEQLADPDLNPFLGGSNEPSTMGPQQLPEEQLGNQNSGLEY